jgi:hypothetical protein
MGKGKEPILTRTEGLKMSLPLNIKSPELLHQGQAFFDLDCPKSWVEFIKNRDYAQLDQEVFKFTSSEGPLRQKLLEFADFNYIEHILSLRTSPDDEEGIWHDDGSRPLAFSLGLNLNPEKIEGGELLFREKGQSSEYKTIPPLAFGRGVVFLTGLWGKEHRVCAVAKSERLVCAGWCTLEKP